MLMAVIFLFFSFFGRPFGSGCSGGTVFAAIPLCRQRRQRTAYRRPSLIPRPNGRGNAGFSASVEE